MTLTSLALTQPMIWLTIKKPISLCLTMKDGFGHQPVKWDKLFFAIEFDAGSKGALF